MKKLILGLLVLGFTTQMNSQTVELKEIELTSNYDYLNASNYDNAALPVKKLILALVDYKLEKSDDNDAAYVSYDVSYSTNKGIISAEYDHKGKLLTTKEKYSNVRLPIEVQHAILKQYPNWFIVDDTYYIHYHHEKGVTKKLYKITLQNADKSLKIKTDDKGNFI